jgi:hypothetical protein
MKYRLTSARLIVSTFGDSFTPDDREPPQILAENLDVAPTVCPVLEEAVKKWKSADLKSPVAAMNQAKADVAKALTASARATYELTGAEQAYRPIRDDKGNIIGHDTILWLFKDGKPITEVDAESFVGMVACVFLSIGPT